jgi:hypothetical protein
MIFNDKKRFDTHYKPLLDFYTPQKFVFQNQGKTFFPDSVTLGKDAHGDWAIYIDSSFAEKGMSVKPFKLFFSVVFLDLDDPSGFRRVSDEEAILWAKLFINRILISKEGESDGDHAAEWFNRRKFYFDNEDFAKAHPLKYGEESSIDLSWPCTDIYSSPENFLDVFKSRTMLLELNGVYLPYSRQCMQKNCFYLSRSNYYNEPGEQHVILPFILNDFDCVKKLSSNKKIEDLIIKFNPLYTFSNVHCSGYGIEVNKFIDRQKNVLYRMFDSDGDLLYVGISCHAQTRFRQHFNKQPWGKDVKNIAVESFADRASLLEAEKNAIKNEKPKHNVTHAG